MAKRTMNVYELHWGPTGQKLGTVTASTVKLARAKAPAPYKKYKGEIGVTLIGPATRSNPVKSYRTQAAAERAHAKLVDQGYGDAGVIYDPSTRLYKVMWTGNKGSGAFHSNPSRSNPSDSALAGARILGVTRNRAGKVTALKLQLKAGAGKSTRKNPAAVGPYTYKGKYGETVSRKTLAAIKTKALFDARTWQKDLRIYDATGRHALTAYQPTGGGKRGYFGKPWGA